jgi:antitoxin HigA-1
MTVDLIRPASGWKVRRVTTSPGEMLQEEFLTPLGISQHALAMKIRVPATRIGDIIHGRRAITADTALRLARFFGNSPEFWLNLQQAYDLSTARMEVERRLKLRSPPPRADGRRALFRGRSQPWNTLFSPFAARGTDSHNSRQEKSLQIEELTGGLARAIPFAWRCYAWNNCGTGIVPRETDAKTRKPLHRRGLHSRLVIGIRRLCP